MMEKYLSPLKGHANDDGKELQERNTPMETKLEEEGSSTVMEVESTSEKLPEKIKSSSHVTDNKNKIKKFKVKKNRGEKRKFPDKSDPKKIKRKKKEEKSTTQIESSFNEDENEAPCILPSTPQCKSITRKESSTPAENDSDVDNTDKSIKQKSSRKSNAIARICKETLDVLLKFNSDVLESMDNSLKIIKSHSLLNNKYISIDVLSNLVSLALESNRAKDFEEASLSLIVSKCVSEACATPKRLKGRQSLVGSPKHKSVVQEEALPSTPTSKDEVTEKETPKNQDSEETAEQMEPNAESGEKSQEQAVEKSGKNFCITNYFKKLKRTVEERDKNERFSCFSTKTDMFLAPKLGGELTGERRDKFEEEFNGQKGDSNYLSEYFCKGRRRTKSAKVIEGIDSKGGRVNETKEGGELINGWKSQPEDAERVVISETESTGRKRVSLIRVDKPKVEPVCRTKAKLLQFHDNRRPPYWGTWRRKSEAVKPRRPFGRDRLFNYEVDSDEEWEEEEEPGESLHGSDDEKEPEEDYEVDNDFFVPHGYLSDDENPEKENMSPKTKLNLLEEQFTSEIKQKTRKMTPIVFGTFWAHEGPPTEGTLYQDLQIDKLQYVPWTSTPVEIEVEEEDKKTDNTLEQAEPNSQTKKPKRKIFPHEEIPNLIKMIHGSPQNSDHLARKFLLYWETEKIPEGNRQGLTKVCVQKKIKELAAWQQSHEKGKMCWQVPKETREEFGAQVESKTPEKKPRKCFIWKFVRKAEKNPQGVGNPPPPPPPTASAVEPEVVILES